MSGLFVKLSNLIRKRLGSLVVCGLFRLILFGPYNLYLMLDITIKEAEGLAREYFSLPARAYPLVSYADANFKLETKEKKYVLKITKAKRKDLEFENELMLYLDKNLDNKIIPELIYAKNGLLMNEVEIRGKSYFLRVIGYCEGSSLAKVKHPSPILLQSLATNLAKIDALLSTFSHPNQNRYISWDAKHAIKNIQENKKYLVKSKEDLINFYLQNYLLKLKNIFPKLRSSIIHNDANDYNILVDTSQTKITGIIDFGDAVKSYLINELAIVCCYIMMDREEPFKLTSTLVSAYHSEYPLEQIELEALFSFIILRFCLSVTMSAKAKRFDPNNSYISISSQAAWQLLKSFQGLDKDFGNKFFKGLINGH